MDYAMDKALGIDIDDPRHDPTEWVNIANALRALAARRENGDPDAHLVFREIVAEMRSEDTADTERLAVSEDEHDHTMHTDDPCYSVHEQAKCHANPDVVVTAAHLNHVPEDCRNENLASWCQGCHLAYDAPIHRANRAETLEQRRYVGMEPLLELDRRANTQKQSGDAR